MAFMRALVPYCKPKVEYTLNKLASFGFDAKSSMFHSSFKVDSKQRILLELVNGKNSLFV